MRVAPTPYWVLQASMLPGCAGPHAPSWPVAVAAAVADSPASPVAVAEAVAGAPRPYLPSRHSRAHDRLAWPSSRACMGGPGFRVTGRGGLGFRVTGLAQLTRLHGGAWGLGSLAWRARV